MASETVRALVVDDSLEVRRRVVEWLNSSETVEVVGQATDAGSAYQEILEKTPHVVILDLSMPGGSGFVLLEKMRTLTQRPTTIVFSNYNLAEYRRYCAELGAEHFLDKSTEFGRLLELVEAVGR